MSVTAKRPVALRIDHDDVQAIDRLAARHKLSRTDYMVNAALGRLDRVGITQRLDALDERLDQLERRVDLSYG